MSASSSLFLQVRTGPSIVLDQAFAQSPLIGPLGRRDGIEYFLPHVGGTIDGQFYDLVTSGSLPNSVPVMFSNVKDEAFLFIDTVVEIPLGNNDTTGFITESLVISPADAVAMQTDPAFAFNTSDSDAVRNGLATIFTTREWICAQEYLLNISSPAASFHPSFPSVYQIMMQDGHFQSTFYTPQTPSAPSFYRTPEGTAIPSSDPLAAFPVLNDLQ